MFRAILVFTASMLATWCALPKPPLLDGISFSQCVRDRDGKVLRITLSTDQKFRVYTPLSQISPELIDATLHFEDKHYARHPGVNPIALARCAIELVRFHRAVAGGSTITMQLARLRFHLYTRTLSGKVEQILRAVELERHYSKSQILEAYLNLAPYGRNIEGIGAASQIYFAKPALRLSNLEAVALSVIPQSPTRRALLAGRENPLTREAQQNWYDRLHSSSGGTELSGREFTARGQATRELIAPHFVEQVLQSDLKAGDIITTLDPSRQEVVEKRLAEYVRSNRNRGIENAAAFLVDTKTMEVLAQVGSADFANIAINGQVDGTRSPRSPGSTLKPFVYALAMEQGLIHPLSIVSDAPRSFGDYNPENFDREFLGPIRACDALARSRNVPAVELASRLAHPTLYQFLKRARVPLSRPEGFYGLSLPLGGAEVSMQNLVTLYAMLANGGELRPLRRTIDPVNDKVASASLPMNPNPTSAGSRCHDKQPWQILSPEAAFLTLEMLGNVPRPEINCADSIHAAPVYWKTGTSHGFRDAWAIGVFDHYVLAVWIGNFDGRGNPSFVGRTAAGPLFFQIIDSLRSIWPQPNDPHVPAPGANLKRVEFCAVSGDLPNASCTHRVEGWFIPGISPIHTCEVHRQILVDTDTGLRVAYDDGTHNIRREVYEFWPSDLLEVFEKAGVPRKAPPPYLPGSGADFVGRQSHIPRILSPTAGEKILGGQNKTLPLSADAEGDVREIFWFAGKSFLGKTGPQQVLSWRCGTGEYELTALDDHGRACSCSVTVR
jgi:penicillin-binding protein 1C